MDTSTMPALKKCTDNNNDYYVHQSATSHYRTMLCVFIEQMSFCSIAVRPTPHKATTSNTVLRAMYIEATVYSIHCIWGDNTALPDIGTLSSKHHVWK